VKFLILIVVLILAAPSVLNRLTPEEERTVHHGVLFRLGRRFGLRTLATAMVTALVVLSLVLYLLVKS
jgi:hypothetical protein